MTIRINQLSTEALTLVDTDFLARDPNSGGTTKKVTPLTISEYVRSKLPFSNLLDVVAPYNTVRALTMVNETRTGMVESTTSLTEPVVNQFGFSRGTTNITFAKNFVVDNTITGISLDGTFASNSDTLLSSQKAIKTYTNNFLRHDGSVKLTHDWEAGEDYTIISKNFAALALEPDLLIQTDGDRTLKSVGYLSAFITSDGGTITVTDDHGTVNLETHGSAASKWDEALGVLTPKTANASVKVTSYYSVERSGELDDCLSQYKNTHASVNQEWHSGLQASGGGIYAIRDVTNDRIPFSINPAAPNNSLLIDPSGSIGFGEESFLATEKFKISHGVTPLFTMLTSGLMTSKISNYDTLVVNDQDFVTKKWVINNSYWQLNEIGGLYYLSPTTITDGLTLGVTTSQWIAQFHYAQNADSYLQITNSATGSEYDKGTKIGVLSNGTGSIDSPNQFNFFVNNLLRGSMLTNGTFNWLYKMNVSGILKNTSLTASRLLSTNASSELTSVASFNTWFNSVGGTIVISAAIDGKVNLETSSAVTSKWNETSTNGVVLKPVTAAASLETDADTWRSFNAYKRLIPLDWLTRTAGKYGHLTSFESWDNGAAPNPTVVGRYQRRISSYSAVDSPLNMYEEVTSRSYAGTGGWFTDVYTKAVERPVVSTALGLADGNILDTGITVGVLEFKIVVVSGANRTYIDYVYTGGTNTWHVRDELKSSGSSPSFSTTQGNPGTMNVYYTSTLHVENRISAVCDVYVTAKAFYYN